MPLSGRREEPCQVRYLQVDFGVVISVSGSKARIVTGESRSAVPDEQSSPRSPAEGLLICVCENKSEEEKPSAPILKVRACKCFVK